MEVRTAISQLQKAQRLGNDDPRLDSALDLLMDSIDPSKHNDMFVIKEINFEVEGHVTGECMMYVNPLKLEDAILLKNKLIEGYMIVDIQRYYENIMVYELTNSHLNN